MKILQGLLKKSAFLVTLEIIVAVIIGVAIVYLLGLPNFNSWRESSKKVAEIKQRIDKVTSNINMLQNTDKGEIEKLEEGFNQVLPSETQFLKFFTLADRIAGASGVIFSAGQAEIAKASAFGTPAAVTPPPVSSANTGSSGPTLGGGSTNPAANAGTTAPQPSDTGSKGSGVKLSFLGRFPNLLKLIGNFGKTDRAALITEITFNNSEDTGNVSVAINFTLPTSSSPLSIDAETVTLLTEDEKEILNSVLDGIIFRASPADRHTGRSDPFR